MKKIFLPIVATTITVLTESSLQAQNANAPSPNSASSKITAYAAEPASYNSATVPDVAIDSKAIRHFSKIYREAKNIRWSKIEGGYLSTFTTSENINRAYYDRRGVWVFTVKYYGEDRMPADERALVKSSYHGYEIRTVEEINLADKTVYMVDIESKNSWKTIRLCDGDLDLVNNFQKL